MTATDHSLFNDSVSRDSDSLGHTVIPLKGIWRVPLLSCNLSVLGFKAVSMCRLAQYGWTSEIWAHTPALSCPSVAYSIDILLCLLSNT